MFDLSVPTINYPYRVSTYQLLYGPSTTNDTRICSFKVVQLPISKMAYSAPPSNMEDHLGTSRRRITGWSLMRIS